MWATDPGAPWQCPHRSVSVIPMRCVYVGSEGWCPHLRRDRCTLSALGRHLSSSAGGGGRLERRVLLGNDWSALCVKVVCMCVRRVVRGGIGGSEL